MQFYLHLDVSENSGTPKSSFLIGFSIINHPFWGSPIFGNTHLLRHFFGGGNIVVFSCQQPPFGRPATARGDPLVRHLTAVGHLFFAAWQRRGKLQRHQFHQCPNRLAPKHQPSESYYAIWLVVSAHFKNMLVKLDHFPW